LLRNSNCGCPLRIGKLAELLLLLLVLLSRDLIACIALFVLEEQLPRKLLVQLGLRGLGRLRGSSCGGGDVVGITHGQKSIHRAILVPADGVDNRMQDGCIKTRKDGV
jgi:hypothetical protein